MTTLQRKGAPLQWRAFDDAEGIIEGYASVFDVVDAYGESVAPGAFADTLAARVGTSKAPKLLWQHNTREPIGRWGTLAEDSRGLFVRGQLNMATQRGREAFAHVAAGDLDGLSIGFISQVEEWDHESDIVVLKKIDLWEVSLVTFPANEAATLTAVKQVFDGETPSIRDLERALRDAGLSVSKAKALLKGGYGALGSRDASEDVEALREAVRAMHI